MNGHSRKIFTKSNHLKVANWTNWQEGEPNNLGGQVRNRRALGEENRVWDMMFILSFP